MKHVICESRILTATAALLLLGVAGCRLPHRLAKDDAGVLQYDSAQVVYELNSRQRALPLGTSQIALASYAREPTAVSDEAELRWKSAVLTIEYPHPNGVADWARATLRLSAHAKQPPGAQESPTSPKRVLARRFLNSVPFMHHDAHSGNGGCDDELWTLDIFKTELDLLLSDLSGGGFFDRQDRPGADTVLGVRVDWGRTTKTWTPEPRLDDFISRVYREGNLRGFVSCNIPAEPAGPAHVDRRTAMR